MKRSTLPSRRLRSESRSMRCVLQLEHLESRLCLTVPAYSSLPGANHTIYLDFDGHVTQGTQWNSYFNNPTINSPAYDTDGNFSSFSASELADIEQIWNRVSEDYIPFQVNVTTVDPGVEALQKTSTSDAQWGIRVILTNDTQGTGAGGVGYVNSFNWGVDTGVFVFTKGGKNAAEAASHEVGHSLGLAHDGTSSSGYYTGHGSGETSWAPLMGVGYYVNVSTWDRGEYYGANNTGSGANYNKGPDDLSVITTYNGFGYRADDVGNTNASSTPLTVNGTSVSGAGIITTTSDVDVFSFTTGAGQVTLNVNPFNPGPNLDIRADLYNSAGSLVATSDSSTTLSAGFNLNLAAGQYYLKIDGTGFGTPGSNPPSGYSDYASLGRYFVSGTIVGAGQFAQLAVNDVTVNESAGTATFTVSLTGTISSNVTVNFATSNGTAVAPGDYASNSGQLTFTPGGGTSQTVTVNIVDDTSTESSETFFLNLSNAVGAVISDSQGTGTITDNDETPTLSLSIGDANKAEGTGSGSTPFTFIVTRTGSSSGNSAVNWSVSASGSGAAKSSDFAGGTFPSGSVSFAAGETSKTITVNVLADTNRESNEKFRVTLSNATGALLGTATADGTIVNDDGNRASRIPDRFPLPGQVFHDEHDHEDDSGLTQVERKQQVRQAVLTQLATRNDQAFQLAAGSSSSRASQNAGASLAAVFVQLREQLTQRAEKTLSSATVKAMMQDASSLRRLDASSALVDQLFTGLKARSL